MFNQIIKNIKNDIFDNNNKIKIKPLLYLLALPISAFGIISYIFSSIKIYESPENLTFHNLIYPSLMLIAVLMKINYQKDKPIALAQLVLFSILWGISLFIIIAGYFKQKKK